MLTALFLLLESVLLAVSCSFDAFAVSFAYGSRKIRIPPLSGHIINLISSFVLGLSLWMGTLLRPYLSGALTAFMSFSLLFLMGLIKLLDSGTKSMIRRYYQSNGENIRREYRFTLLNFSFILSLYANPEEADTDHNQIISAAEAGALALSLSLDGIAVGFGAALGSIHIGAVLLTSLLTNMAAIGGGCFLGRTLARKLPFQVSWLSGAILISLAIFRLF